MRYTQINEGMDRFFSLMSSGYRPYLEAGDIRDLVNEYSDELVTVEDLEDEECDEYIDEATDRFHEVWDQWSEEVFEELEVVFRGAFIDAIYELGRPLDVSREDMIDEDHDTLMKIVQDQAAYVASARAGFERNLPYAVEKKIEEDFDKENLPPREYDGYFKRNVVRYTMRMMQEFEKETLPRMVREHCAVDGEVIEI